MADSGRGFVGDTSMGGAPGAFPATTWGLISRCCDAKTEPSKADLEELCRRYWKPAYRFIRIGGAKSNEDAKDLCQGFFLWLLEGDALKRYAPGRGSFRRYLKVVLGSFIGDQRKAMQSIKRGGQERILPIDDGEFSAAAMVGDAKTLTPEQAFDRAWAVEVARTAVERVRGRYEREGRGLQFRVYESYDLNPGAAEPTYAEVAARLGIKENDVRNYLAWVRSAVQAEVRAELARLTTDAADLEDEWNALFGG